jgi:hypothetical protein
LSPLKRILLEKLYSGKLLPMREGFLVLAVALSFSACERTQRDDAPSTSNSRQNTTSVPSATASSTIDFATQIQPILEVRCQPCHFAGGKMYERLPFDRPETIKALGTKLFSRIEDETERRAIREFLAQK